MTKIKKYKFLGFSSFTNKAIVFALLPLISLLAPLFIGSLFSYKVMSPLDAENIYEWTLTILVILYIVKVFALPKINYKYKIKK